MKCSAQPKLSKIPAQLHGTLGKAPTQIRPTYVMNTVSSKTLPRYPHHRVTEKSRSRASSNSTPGIRNAKYSSSQFGIGWFRNAFRLSPNRKNFSSPVYPKTSIKTELNAISHPFISPWISLSNFRKRKGYKQFLATETPPKGTNTPNKGTNHLSYFGPRNPQTLLIPIPIGM